MDGHHFEQLLVLVLGPVDAFSMGRGVRRWHGVRDVGRESRGCMCRKQERMGVGEEDEEGEGEGPTVGTGRDGLRGTNWFPTLFFQCNH